MPALHIKLIRTPWWSRKVRAVIGLQRRDEGPIEVRTFELGKNEYIEITSEDLA